jgi:hypothetical protein
MPDPVIVPPTPTINQGDKIQAPPPTADTSANQETVERIFDKVYPMKGNVEAPKSTPPVTTTEPSATPPETPQTIAPTEPEPALPDKTPTERKMPSFLEEALKPEPSQVSDKPAPPTTEDWPEEFPDPKASDATKANWKKFRTEYNTLKEQVKNRPAASPQDEAARARLQMLETQNKEMQTTLSRFGVEQNVEFQQNVLQPLHASWNEATRIVKDAGKDPQDLARALSLSGKAQFEALDELMVEMPESAKAEIHDAIRAFRHFDVIRQNALRNAPQTYEQLRKKELERQYQSLNEQKQEMVSFFDDAVKTLRDEAKVEILRKTDDPESRWWNDQAQEIVDSAKNLYLENTDMKKMAIACVLAPMADKYRKLWMVERAQRANAEKTLKEKFGAEPSLSSSGGNAGNLIPSQQAQEDLKRPFSEVFLREFHKSRASGH